MTGRKVIGFIAGFLGLCCLAAGFVFVILAVNTPGDDGWGESVLASLMFASIFAYIFDVNIEGLGGITWE